MCLTIVLQFFDSSLCASSQFSDVLSDSISITSVFPAPAGSCFRSIARVVPSDQRDDSATRFSELLQTRKNALVAPLQAELANGHTLAMAMVELGQGNRVLEPVCEFLQGVFGIFDSALTFGQPGLSHQAHLSDRPCLRRGAKCCVCS
jgi:hypothetical protein